MLRTRELVQDSRLPALNIGLAVCGLALCLFAACGSNLSPQETAFQSVAASVDRADESARPGTFDAMVRWSEADCGVPEWQILLWGDWQRAEIRGLGDAHRDEVARKMRLRTQRGSTKDTNGWAYPIVEFIAELDL